jgi:hypothetical protein
MKQKVYMTLLCLFLGAAANAQNGGPKPPNEQPTLFADLVKIGGWDVPGANQGKLIKKTVLPGPDGKNITKTFFRLDKEVPSEVPFYFYYASDRTLNIQPKQYLVDALNQYDIDGRVFCYGVLANYLDPGAGRLFLYCDRDGDGKFEWFSYGLRPGQDLPDIPSWVLSPRPSPESTKGVDQR